MLQKDITLFLVSLVLYFYITFFDFSVNTQNEIILKIMSSQLTQFIFLGIIIFGIGVKIINSLEKDENNLTIK